jgi:type I restriction enzyme M protein
MVDYRNNTKAFLDIRNYLAGKTIGITRDKSLLHEIVKCLFCKALGMFGETENSTPESVAKYYRESFAKVKRQCPSAFGSDEEILLDPESINYVDRVIRNIDFLDAASDPLGDLYQTFTGTVVQGSEGQFFTPPQAVNWIISAINPRKGEKIIDPACGAGGFLFNAARHLKKGGATDHEIAGSIFGIEKDAYLSKLANTHMALATLQETNIFCGDSIERKGLDGTGLPIEMENSFDIVVANPPFGAKIKVGSDNARRRLELARKWVLDKEDGTYNITEKFVANPTPQVLFLEICLKLLKEGGRLGVVVPESMVSNTGSSHVVHYLLKNTDLNATIGMPENLFKTSGKGGTHTKTCLIIATKKMNPSFNQKIFMAEAKWCGNDSRGNRIPHNDLPIILERYLASKDTKVDGGKDHLGYSVDRSTIKNFVLAPRYYDPRINIALKDLDQTHELVTVGQLIKDGVLEIKTGDEVGKLSYGTGDIPFVRTSDISNWEVKIDPKHGLSEEIFTQYAKKQDVRENDLLMVRDGTYLIGTCALVTKFDTKIVYQSHLYKIRVNKPKVISPYVLLAALSSKPVVDQIQSKRFTQDIIDTLGKRINELVLPIPKNPERVEYLKIIVKKSIDDRVESRELARHAKSAIIEMI